MLQNNRKDPSDIRPGDIVRYRKPGLGEDTFLMVVIEWNGDRGICEHLSPGMAIHPVELLELRDIKIVIQGDGRRFQHGEAIEGNVTNPVE